MLNARRIFHAFAKIGFIGLGNMGLPMATNLVSKGHTVLGFDVDSNKAEEAKKRGFAFTSQLQEVAKWGDSFVVMVPSCPHSKEVCESPEGTAPHAGLFKLAKKDSLIIDCSTISPVVSRELNQRAKAFGMTYVDSPVSGGTVGAEKGTLTFMVGAEDQAVFEKVRGVVEHMGKNVLNCNGAGAGALCKLCNNLALGVQMAAVAEAMILAKKMGLEQSVVSNIMKTSTAGCWVLNASNPVPGVMPEAPASRDYERGYNSELALKDLRLACAVAKEVGSPVAVTEVTREMYEGVIADGLGKKDFGVIYQWLSSTK